MEMDAKSLQTSQETTSGITQAAITDSREPTHLDIKEGSSTREELMVAEENVAIELTGEVRPRRNLKNFIFRSLKGFLWPVEMYDVVALYITSTILPLDEKSMVGGGVRCECFGKIDSWEIRGHESGSPEIWVFTASADYLCTKPAHDYKQYFEATLRKVVICIEVFTKLSRRHGGNPELNLDELLSQVVHSISRCGIFSERHSNKDYVISLGAFIYHQLTKSNEIIGKNDQSFTSLPVLVALRDECKRCDVLTRPPPKFSGAQSNFRYRIVLKSNIGAISKMGMETDNYSCPQKRTSLRTGDIVASSGGLKFVLKHDIGEISRMHTDPDKYYSPQKGTSWSTGYIMANSGGPSHAGTKDGLFTEGNLKAREETFAERPSKILMNFVFHNSHGLKQSLEVCKVIDLYITTIVPTNGKGMRHEHFGQVLSWQINGFGLKNPSIWVSTEEADYACIEPAPDYKEYFDVTFRKVLICALVFKLVSAADHRNQELSLNALLSVVVSLLRTNEYFAGSTLTKDYIISLGLFISKQLTLFDDVEENGEPFTDSPVIVALRDECKRRAALSMPLPKISGRSLKTQGETLIQSVSSSGTLDGD